MPLSVEDERTVARLVVRYIAIRQAGTPEDLDQWREEVLQAFPNGLWGDRLCIPIGELLQARGAYLPRVEGVA